MKIRIPQQKFLFTCFGIFAIFTTIRIVSDEYRHVLDHVVQIYELIIHLVLIYSIIQLYQRIASNERVIILWLFITCICFFLNDFAFYFGIFCFSHSDNLEELATSNIQILSNNIPFSMWLISSTLFLSQSLMKYVVSRRNFIYITSFLVLLTTTIIIYYWLPIDHPQNIISYGHYLYLVATTVLEMLIFALAILCLIHARTNGVILLLTGLITMIAGDFITTYGYMSQLGYFFKYGDSIWCLGILLLLSGIYIVHDSKQYTLEKWFYHSSRIRTQISLWSFILALFSFVIFLVLSHQLGLLSYKVSMLLPLFVMFYSIVVVFLSLQMGRIFEEPFLSVRRNIKRYMEHKDILKQNFTTYEFQALQDFLLDSVAKREAQELLRKQFSDVATSAAHDIISPINALKIALKNTQDGASLDQENALLINRASSQIQSIANNLLLRYRELGRISCEVAVISVDDSEPGAFILADWLMRVVHDKSTEFGSSIIKLNIADNVADKWCFASIEKMSRSLSNLLNNAFSAVANTDIPEIEVSCSLYDEQFVITIQDNGCGVPADEVSNILFGKSLSATGNGLGLSSSKKFIESIGGEFVFSSTLDLGSEVAIKINSVATPCWYQEVVDYHANSIFVLFNQDPTVLMTWMRLLPASTERKMFTDVDELSEYLSIAMDNVANLIFICDSSLAAIEFSKPYQFASTIILTPQINDAKLQVLANQYKFILMPDIERISFSYTIHLNTNR